MSHPLVRSLVTAVLMALGVLLLLPMVPEELRLAVVALGVLVVHAAVTYVLDNTHAWDMRQLVVYVLGAVVMGLLMAMWLGNNPNWFMLGVLVLVVLAVLEMGSLRLMPANGQSDHTHRPGHAH